MKIAKKYYEPNASDSGPWTARAVTALRIEARLLRKEGFKEQAHGAELIAMSLKRVGQGESYANAFDWPKGEP